MTHKNFGYYDHFGRHDKSLCHVLVSFIVYTFSMLLAVVNYFWPASILSTILHLLYQWSNVKSSGKKKCMCSTFKVFRGFRKEKCSDCQSFKVFQKEKVQSLKFLKVFKEIQFWYKLCFQPKWATCFQKFYTVYFTNLHLVLPLGKPCILYNDETY